MLGADRSSNMYNWIEAVTLLMLLSSSMQVELPPDFQICKRSDENFNQCLKEAIQDALPKCGDGLPDFNVPKMEPVVISEATVGEGATGAVHVIQHYTNINLYNFTHTKVDKVEAAMTDTEFNLTIAGKMLDFIWDSDYDFNGNILILPISGKGKCFAAANSVTVSLTYIGEVYEKKGEKYLKVNSADLNFSPDDFRVQFKNLFNGDERLGAEMNKVLNENWRELWADTKPSYESLFQTFLVEYMNRILKRLPLDKIFPM